MSVKKIYVIIPFLSSIDLGPDGVSGSRLQKPIKEFYLNKAEAYEEAEERAAKTPGILYHVLESTSIFEAVSPTIHHKGWNESGELQVKD